ncbi:Pkinase-domain-containing protein, partial [Linderina pennispora]
MYARQHPVYRPLSTDFAKLHRQGVSQNHRDGNADELTAHDFTFMERIGRGGFGKVYRAVLTRNARHLPLARSSGGEVAIKKIDKAALKSRAAEQRLAAEVAIHETLGHTHIVRLYDSFEDSQYVYIVMELCSHGDIWRYLRNRGKLDKSLTTELAPLSEAEARHVMQQVCRGIAYLHGRQILHRDLKLANILLTETLDVRIGDFGLATWLRNDRTETTTMCGTPSYISPEILARQPYGVESDVWALGCLFVTLLTGAQPFRNVSRITEDAVRQIRLPYDLSHEARNLVRAMLRIDPRQRITTQRLLEHPFF